MEGDTSHTVEPENEGIVFKVKQDVGWKYGFCYDKSNRDKLQCKLCAKKCSGGVYRMKQHIAGILGQVAPCKLSTDEDKIICREAIQNAQKKKKNTQEELMKVRQEVNINCSDDDDDCVVLGNKRKKSGPMDSFALPIDIGRQLQKNTKQPKIKDALDKKKWQRVAELNARWVYVSGVSFNSIQNDVFYQFMEGVGQYGPGYQPPNQYQLGGPFLKREVENTKNSLKKHEEEWVVNGCSILTDAWTDQKRRSIMNICVNCKEGTTFVSSIEASGDAHTGEYIYKYVLQHIQELGEEKVVQVVTDNASNNMAAAGFLKTSHPNIFWTSCAAHTVNLMLEGIAGLKKIRDIIGKAKSLVIFIYSHHSTLNLMRKNTKKRDIVRPGATRFATAFLTLQSLLEKKENLRKMFISNEWGDSKVSKCKKGKTSSATVLSLSFWNGVALSLNVFGPLVELLRIVDGDRRPSMPFLFGELKRAKIVIKDVVKDSVLSHKIMGIIEDKGKNRIDTHLHLAAYFLNPFYLYNDRKIEEEDGVMPSVLKCVEKFFPDNEDMQNKVGNGELLAYKDQRGSFGTRLALKGCAVNHDNYDPVGWWSMHGSDTPNLRKMAKRILALTSSSSGCERNWSTFEGIHTKKRNRLDVARLNNLVYVQFNAKIINRNKKRERKGKPLKFLHGEDASMAQGWLVEGGDEEVDPETGIPWSVIGDASGADEVLAPRKTTRNLDKPRELEDKDFLSEEESVDEEEEDEIEYDESEDD